MVSSTDHSITQIKITYKLVWNTCRYYTEDDGQKTLNSLYEEWFHCEDLGTQLGPIIKRYATESCYMQYIGSNATFESSKSGFLYFQFVELRASSDFFDTHFERSLSYKHHNIFSWHFLHPFTFSDFLLRSSARQANLCQVRSLPGMLIYVPELRVLSGFTRHSPHSCTLYVGLKYTLMYIADRNIVHVYCFLLTKELCFTTLLQNSYLWKMILHDITCGMYRFNRNNYIYITALYKFFMKLFETHK